MKRYEFRLATVLRVRKAEEDAARGRLIEANRLSTLAASVAAQRLEHYRDLGSTQTWAELSVEEVLANRQQLGFAATALRQADLQKATAGAATHEALGRYVVAAQRLSVLERLDERNRADHALDAAKAETAELDDLVVGRRTKSVDNSEQERALPGAAK